MANEHRQDGHKEPEDDSSQLLRPFVRDENAPREPLLVAEPLQQLLRHLQEGALLRWEVRSAVQQFGEAHFRQAIPVIEHLLAHEDPLIRKDALRALTQAFKLPAHWETARRFLLEDPYPEARLAGCTALADLQEYTGDPKTLALLAAVVCNPVENRLLRKEAYGEMRRVIWGPIVEPFQVRDERFVLERHADWALIHASLDDEGRTYLRQKYSLRIEADRREQLELQRRLEHMQQHKWEDRKLLPTLISYGKKRFFPVVPEIERLLGSADSRVRAIALKTLALHFGLDKYWGVAQQFLLYDPDEQCRIAGAEALSYLKQDTQERRTLLLLATIVQDENLSAALRRMAYAAFQAVRHYDIRTWSMHLSEQSELVTQEGWNAVLRYNQPGMSDEAD